MQVILELIKWFSIQDLAAAGYGSNIAQVPSPIAIGDTIYVYLSGRNSDNISHVNLVCIDSAYNIKSISNRIFLHSDLPGTFDDEGVMPAQVIKYRSGYIMFYSGWNSRNTIPYHNATGIAFSSDLLKWTRLYQGPILDRTPHEPYLAVTPWVHKRTDGLYEMLYISGTGYIRDDDRYEPVYTVKYAKSSEIMSWERFPDQVMPFQWTSDSICFSHPTFIPLDNMSFMVAACVRQSRDYRCGGSNSYKLVFGFTETLQKVHKLHFPKYDIPQTITNVQVNFQEMQAYPSFIRINDDILCFYNGNGFGRSGFGVARVKVIYP
jgi:hypothetical protein